MMPEGLIFLLIIWSWPPLASGNTGKQQKRYIRAVTNHHQFSLGCQAVMPCQHFRSDSKSFRWFYKKDEGSDTRLIYFQDKTGVEHHQDVLRPRMKVLPNGSLVIDHFTEEDQGLYWCGNNSSNKPLTVISVKKEILKETQKTFYVLAGSSFIHACQREFNLIWTFKSSTLRNSVQRPQSEFVTPNKSLHIVNVQRDDAGKYTCWRSGCNGHEQKLLTITLCVITDVSKVSSASCAVICDIKPNGTLTVKAGTRTIPVLADPNGSLNCSAEQMFDGYGAVNSTYGPANTSNATDIPTEPECQLAVICGTSAALVGLIFMALLICCRSRLLAAFPVHYCCCGLNGRAEERTSVKYSSVVFRRPATSKHIIHSSNGCVYSELNV